MNKTQKVVLDSCVVIDLMEGRSAGHTLRAGLRGKSVSIVLCDVVLDEVRRVRGWGQNRIVRSISRLLGRRIEITRVPRDQMQEARRIREQYSTCHRGDDLILCLCRLRTFVLVTFDRMLLQTCGFVGVAAFHPSSVRGI